MKKILFIDDEKEIHPLIQKFFPKNEFRLICAFDGLEGLQKCRNEVFDLIIVDDQMPKMDGFKFCHQLRDLQNLKKQDFSPVIFISRELESLPHNFKWDRCEFLKKPFNKEALFSTMQRLAPEKVKARALGAEIKISLLSGEYLVREGEDSTSLYYVVKGVFDTFKTSENGEKKYFGKVGTGELLGEITLLSKERSPLTFIALEDCEVIPIPREKVLTIVDGQPKWIKLILESMSKKLADTIKRIA